MTTYITKAAVEIKDYEIDWHDPANDVLGDDTIATSTWTADSGLTISAQSNTTTTTTVWLSGGLTNNSYTATNVITTAGGRTFEDSLTVTIQQN
jgi:hypothetical protein